MKKKVSVSEKKFFGSDTEIGLLFQFLIPKPGFVRNLPLSGCCMLFWTSLNRFMSRLGRATCTVYSIYANTSKKEIKCIKAKA